MGGWFPFALAATPTDLRLRVLDAVQRFPGLHLREISRMLEIPPSHAQYHLRVLERTSFVRVVKEAAHVRYFATSSTPVGPMPALGSRERESLALLRKPMVLKIVVFLVLEGSLTLSDLARRCGITPSTVLHHLHQLERAGLVQRLIQPGSEWRLVDPVATRTLLLAHEPPPRYLEGFLETWQRLSP